MPIKYKNGIPYDRLSTRRQWLTRRWRQRSDIRHSRCQQSGQCVGGQDSLPFFLFGQLLQPCVMMISWSDPRWSVMQPLWLLDSFIVYNVAAAAAGDDNDDQEWSPLAVVLQPQPAFIFKSPTGHCSLERNAYQTEWDAAEVDRISNLAVLVLLFLPLPFPLPQLQSLLSTPLFRYTPFHSIRNH